MSAESPSARAGRSAGGAAPATTTFSEYDVELLRRIASERREDGFDDSAHDLEMLADRLAALAARPAAAPAPTPDATDADVRWLRSLAADLDAVKCHNDAHRYREIAARLAMTLTADQWTDVLAAARRLDASGVPENERLARTLNALAEGAASGSSAAERCEFPDCGQPAIGTLTSAQSRTALCDGHARLVGVPASGPGAAQTEPTDAEVEAAVERFQAAARGYPVGIVAMSRGVRAVLRGPGAAAPPTDGPHYVSHNGLVDTLLLLYRSGPNTGYSEDRLWLPEQRVAVVAMLNLLAQLHPAAVADLRAADRGPTAIPLPLRPTPSGPRPASASEETER